MIVLLFKLDSSIQKNMKVLINAGEYGNSFSEY